MGYGISLPSSSVSVFISVSVSKTKPSLPASCSSLGASPSSSVDHLLYLSNFLHHHYHPLVEQSFFFVRQLEGILAYFPERGKKQKLKQEIKMKDGI